MAQVTDIQPPQGIVNVQLKCGHTTQIKRAWAVMVLNRPDSMLYCIQHGSNQEIRNRRGLKRTLDKRC